VQCFGGASDCVCSRNIECSIEGKFSEGSNVEITGDEFKCTVAFDRAILDLESTAIDNTFEVGVLSAGSTNFLKELDVISRDEGVGQCLVNTRIAQHAEPAVVLDSLGVEAVSLLFLKDDGSYASSTFTRFQLREIAVAGDYTLNGQLSPENACSFQHLFFQLTSLASQPPTTLLPAVCRDRQSPTSEDTIITFAVTC